MICLGTITCIFWSSVYSNKNITQIYRTENIAAKNVNGTDIFKRVVTITCTVLGINRETINMFNLKIVKVEVCTTVSRILIVLWAKSQLYFKKSV